MYAELPFLLFLIPVTTSFTPQRVFCYGDSLTAGSSPPLSSLYPYAPILEKFLKHDGVEAQVRHRGLPGWTAETMLEYSDDAQAGMRSAIRRISDPSVSVVVILAGTNDLAFSDNSAQIAGAVTAIHSIAHEQGIASIAVSIPPSQYQTINKNAAALATETNNRIEEWCNNSNGKCVWCRNPITKWDEHGGNFSPDGLHLSPEGYEVFGRGLANVVKSVLKDLGNNEQLIN